MLIEVKVPELSESVAEATLLAWHKKAGEAVKRDENLIDIETDKVVLELPSPADGVLAQILTTFNEVNMQPVVDLRKKYQERFEKEHGVRLGFMSFVVKASVHALKKYPIVNASIDGNDIVYHGYFDIGIAVGSPRGLV